MRATSFVNIERYQKFRPRPLEFDGRKDSIYHPFDLDGNKHMEYVRFRGELPDVPIEAIAKTFREHYTMYDLVDGDFDRDVELETG